MSASQVQGVEIHDLDERRVVAFDLGDLLDALPRTAGLDWIVTDYDPVCDSSRVEGFRQAVYQAQTANPRSGVRLTYRELRDLIREVTQTIDGQFIGVPADATTPVHELVDLRTFPSSQAEIVVKAVDSSFWIVISKSRDDIEMIRKTFLDVREADRTLELGYQLGP